MTTSSGVAPAARPRVVMVFRRVLPRVVANLNAAAKLVDLTLLEVDATSDSRSQLKAEAVSFPIISMSRAGRHQVAKRLSKLDPDAVLVLGWFGPGALFAIDWAISNRKPVIAASDSNAVDYRRRSHTEAVKRILVSSFSAVWAASDSARDYSLALGVQADRIVTGPIDTTDNDHFARNADQLRARGNAVRLSAKLPEQYFLTVCRLSPEKNLVRLLKAWKLQKTSLGKNAWSLVVVGDGPMRQELETVRSNLELGDQVHFVGAVSYGDLPLYLAFASAFILASEKDTWGVVVNEAAATGLPLIVSRRAGSSGHLLQEGINGLTIDPFDVQNIAQAISRMAGLTEAERARMGNASRQIAAGWTPATYARSFADVINLACCNAVQKHSILTRSTVRLAALSQSLRPHSG